MLLHVQLDVLSTRNSRKHSFLYGCLLLSFSSCSCYCRRCCCHHPAAAADVAAATTAAVATAARHRRASAISRDERQEEEGGELDGARQEGELPEAREVGVGDAKGRGGDLREDAADGAARVAHAPRGAEHAPAVDGGEGDGVRSGAVEASRLGEAPELMPGLNTSRLGAASGLGDAPQLMRW